MNYSEAVNALIHNAPDNVPANAAREYLAGAEEADNERDRATEILYAHCNISFAQWEGKEAEACKRALAAEYTRITGIPVSMRENGDQK